jgi:hypothetical protein
LSKSSLMDTHIYSDPERSLTNLRYESKAFDLAKIQAIEARKWEEIRAKESEGNKLHWSPEKHFEERIKIVNKYEPLLKKPGLRDIIWQTSIGHYGGLYVEVPEEHFDEFKAQFPPREFPREVRTVDVRDKYTFEGEQAFRSRFPNSNRIKEVFFADRSKGSKRLDYMELPHGDLSD